MGDDKIFTFIVALIYFPGLICLGLFFCSALLYALYRPIIHVTGVRGETTSD